jgi:dolichyl-phosphate-mannose-protein mannosyltransferase
MVELSLHPHLGPTTGTMKAWQTKASDLLSTPHPLTSSVVVADQTFPRRFNWQFPCLIVVLLVGIFLRLPPSLFQKPDGVLRGLVALHPQPASQQLGFDEVLYRDYTDKLIRFGLLSYPEIIERYREKQQTLTGSILPPVRFLYIFSAYTWHQLFGSETLTCLKNVSALATMLTLLVATIFATRLGDFGFRLGVAGLMAFAPMQLHMSQHALVDGFFTFWATLVLWLLWENLQCTKNWRWLTLYSVALTGMVLTKENAFFAGIAVVAVLVANHWLKLGVVTRELVLATGIGPLLGIVILAMLAGGVAPLIDTYRLSVSKNYELKYAILTGDGPWYRYLVDLMLVNPVVLLLAIGSMFTLRLTKKAELFCLVFIGASYLVMCNVKYGMNLRYANMWDLPLCILAFSQLRALAGFVARRWRSMALFAAVALTCALELRNYIILAVEYPLYELVTPGLMRSLKILKSPADLNKTEP